jgi:hypothetical protein
MNNKTIKKKKRNEWGRRDEQGEHGIFLGSKTIVHDTGVHYKTHRTYNTNCEH